MQLDFYLPIFSTKCMGHLLYLMFRCDFDVMESLENLEEFGRSEHRPGMKERKCSASAPALSVIYFSRDRPEIIGQQAQDSGR